ncbi:hypothetical protein [Allorhizocola rhizosphaerae]|uniref:hypothetical protein n=1 Tax=Allorhizocola rhizosphaerae TaxID=1872709 RepID=UPI0013C36B90|nr:hypothetical protein [Allorhizocola rhizosphaerae]
MALRLGVSQTELLEQLSDDEAAFSLFLTFLRLAEREREQWTVARGCEVFATAANDARIIDHAELVLEVLAKLRPLETRLLRVLAGRGSRPPAEIGDEGELERDRASLPTVDTRCGDSVISFKSIRDWRESSTG